LNDEFRRASAMADFRDARRKAAFRQTLERLTGQSNELLSYDTVANQLGSQGSAERGLREIPLDAIAGSVGRPNDFTRDFLPKYDGDLERWTKVRMLAGDPGTSGLPPIKVYQVGAAYFIVDGHHRVSVARALGATHIQAYVTEVHTRAPLSANATPDEVIAKAESIAFLEETGLGARRADADLAVTVPGDATHLTSQVDLHQQALAEARGESVSRADAAEHWYDTVYLPAVQVLREQGVSRLFPDYSEADLYLMVSAHRRQLEEALGWEISPQLGAANLAAQQSAANPGVVSRAKRLLEAVVPREFKPGPEAGAWRRERTAARYSDHLFSDILVPLPDRKAPSVALDLALKLAAREGSHVHGLHVVSSARRQTGAAVETLREKFAEACQGAGITGSLAVEVGEVSRKVCDLASLNDLVVIPLAHPPGKKLLARLGSGFRTIVRRCPRPVLAVSGPAEPPGPMVLAYDGSPKAEEALFVAAYFAETWRAPLTVVTVAAQNFDPDSVLGHVRDYLEMHEVEAAYEVRATGTPAEAVLSTAENKNAALILMGGYGSNPVVEAVLGSALDQVLRQSRRPVLICQ
jgi:nucleotide-binding universal stress UspA family protein